MKKKLLISFSGGRTSGYMLWWLTHEWSDRHQWDIIVVFANTGKEDEATLRFVDQCSREWDVNIIWVEGVPVKSKRGKWWGVTHRLVNFISANRTGKPFEDMIMRLGIPSTSAPFCSPQLKRAPIKSYLRSIGWRKYYTAIGIRGDEIDRMNPKWKELRIMYPFISLHPTTRPQVMKWWSNQSFDLTVDPDLGNCDACWKKDLLRLTRIAKNTPQRFSWWQRMTDTYGYLNPRNTPLKPPFNFYRGNMSPVDIFKAAQLSVAEICDKASLQRLDGCSESCEAF